MKAKIRLANYTSEVPASRTINEIEQLLAIFGARAVQKEYENGCVRAFTFTIATGGRLTAIRLPVDIKAVFKVLEKSVRRYRRGTLYRLEEQADRTAWRIMRDWLRVQLSLIELEQAEPIQVFLPYLWDDQRQQSFYGVLKLGGFKALPAADEVDSHSEA